MLLNGFELNTETNKRAREHYMIELYNIQEILKRLSTPRRSTDFSQLKSTTMKVQEDTITYSVNENRIALIGGRTKSEKITPVFIDSFMEKFLPELCEPISVFFEKTGIPKHAQEIFNNNNFVPKTPYSFTKTHGVGLHTAMDDNVLINPNRGTVLKFLRSKESISGFLLSVYLCAKHPKEFKLARCLAYYPEIMCAEYEYAGENLEAVMTKMRTDKNINGLKIMHDAMDNILLQLRERGGLCSTSVHPFNFCLNYETGVVKMTCVEWMVPTYNQ